MRRVACLLLAAAFLTEATACSERGDRSHLSQSSTTREDLAGTRWSIETIDGKRPTGAAQIMFDDRQVAVMLDCGDIEGPWRAEGNRLVAGPFRQSEQECPREAWNQSSTMVALLVATPRVNATGTALTLQSSGHTVEFTRLTR